MAFTDLHEISDMFDALTVPTYFGLRQIQSLDAKAEAQREYRKANPEKVRASEREYLSRPEVKQSRAEYMQAYRQEPGYAEKHRERVRKGRSTPEGAAAHRGYMRAYRARKALGLPV